MNAQTTETKTVYIGKGRYGTNHKGHAIATHTPAQRPTPGQGEYVYTITITDLDGTETVLPEPVEAIHAEAVAVKVWEERNTPAAEPKPRMTTAQLETTHSGNDETGHITTDREIQTYTDTPENGPYAGKEYIVTTTWRGNQPGMRHAMTSRSSEPHTPEPAPAVTYIGGGVWDVAGKGIIAQGITQAWYARDVDGTRVTIKGHTEWGGPQRPAAIAAMVDW